ncbi:MAG: hypothetical protein PHQ05_11645 [Sterolibacterium sp.]|nr:hypothetical protein [Sterolibacterium sp.]
MKLALSYACILASANVFAQQAPGVINRPAAEPPKIAAPSWKIAPPLAVVPPITGEKPTNAELTELLRAQTIAIKSLSSKLESFEQRIEKIERRLH